jgi:hypothetical protein
MLGLQGYSRPGIWDCPIARQARRALGLGSCPA